MQKCGIRSTRAYEVLFFALKRYYRFYSFLSSISETYLMIEFEKCVSPKDSEVAITELMKPMHSNFSGKIHGGYILNLMDQIAFACASKYSGKYCVTASVNRVDFKNPVNVGEFISLHARVNYVGNTSMTVGIRVMSENIQSGKQVHCNSSFFVMVAKEEDGSNAAVPPLCLRTAEDVRRFLRSKNRMESAKANSKTFSEKLFAIDKHLDELTAQHNVFVDPDLFKT